MLRGRQYINIIAIILILVVLWLGVTFLDGLVSYENSISSEDEAPEEITSFEECVEADGVVMESYPEQCRTDDGQTFTRDIGNELEKTDLIRIDNPRPGEVVSSPLTITGEARGYWFFEASFPVEIQDENGNVLATYYASAVLDPDDPESTWMTEDFVPFESQIEFEMTEARAGILILRRDNPSDLRENDDELVVPIKF